MNMCDIAEQNPYPIILTMPQVLLPTIMLGEPRFRDYVQICDLVSCTTCIHGHTFNPPKDQPPPPPEVVEVTFPFGECGCEATFFRNSCKYTTNVITRTDYEWYNDDGWYPASDACTAAIAAKNAFETVADFLDYGDTPLDIMQILTTCEIEDSVDLGLSAAADAGIAAKAASIAAAAAAAEAAACDPTASKSSFAAVQAAAAAKAVALSEDVAAYAIGFLNMAHAWQAMRNPTDETDAEVADLTTAMCALDVDMIPQEIDVRFVTKRDRMSDSCAWASSLPKRVRRAV